METARRTFRELQANLRKEFSGLRPLRVGVAADFSTQMLQQALRGLGRERGYDLEIEGYDLPQLRALLAGGAAAGDASPDYVLLFESPFTLRQRFWDTPPEARADFARAYIEDRTSLWDQLQDRFRCTIVQSNGMELREPTFGNFGTNVEASFTYQLRKLNYELMRAAQEKKSVFLNDCLALQHLFGVDAVVEPRLHAYSQLDLHLDFLPALAANTLDIIGASQGQLRKCLVLDLDNTLWGGVVGELGWENLQIGDFGIGLAFTELQTWARELQRRGIILAVCSKNDLDLAREVFERHEDMVLGLDDIAVFVANWDNKVDNLRLIQRTLNISFDSMVFLDDNPVERNLVRTHLPDVVVPELPEDPSLYVTYLTGLNLFECATYSSEDRERTKKYQQEYQRQCLQKDFTSIDEYLASLEMEARLSPWDDFTIPRAAQLTQRTNQFNLRTQRYSEQDIKTMIASDAHLAYAYGLADRFGDYGTVSLVIGAADGSALFLDTWLMSCRVIGRTLEAFVLNHFAEQARERGYATLVGEFLPSPKNSLVADHYRSLGFVAEGGRWHLDLREFAPRETQIRWKQDSN